MGTMSVRDTGSPHALSAQPAQPLWAGWCCCRGRGRGRGCSAHPEASPSSWRGSRCHVLWLHKTSVPCRSCCSVAGIPGCQGGFRPCPIPFQILHQNKKGIMQKYLSGPHLEKTLHQHAGMLMWAQKPQEQVHLFCRKRELKLQSCKHWLFWHSVNAFDWQKHTEPLPRSVSPTEIPALHSSRAGAYSICWKVVQVAYYCPTHASSLIFCS